MKIREYSATLEEKMSEFDMWVTPSLGEIRDTMQFQENLVELQRGFDYVAQIANGFEELSQCAPQRLAENALRCINEQSEETALKVLDAICNVLLLASGKTDNNLKCQYPLMLRNQLGIASYPQRKSGKMKPVPRVFSINDVTKVIVSLKKSSEYQRKFIESYFYLIISDESYAKQLWSLGNAYVCQKKKGCERELISSMVIFQSRGSITATQGHIPETILRKYMEEWGLKENEDFNATDVEVGEILDGVEVDSKLKKRKYDFIVPFKSKKDGAKVFIQSQFYAGDSGSVSHKVVDQTDSTRVVTLKKYPNAVFLEYLDGAGYFASLNGDLRKMLAKPTTKNFIQIKTAPIKLRRELQEAEFLTPLEIEHAILRTDGKEESIRAILKTEGYSEKEIDRAITIMLENKMLIVMEDKRYAVHPLRMSIVRKYCVLDIIANYGKPIPVDKKDGCLFVAGFENMHGLQLGEISKKVVEVFWSGSTIWENVQDAFDDVQWLIDNKFVIMK